MQGGSVRAKDEERLVWGWIGLGTHESVRRKVNGLQPTLGILDGGPLLRGLLA